MIKFDEISLLNKNGCEYCMDYDWKKHTEIAKDLSNIKLDGKELNFCPFCGRKIKVEKSN